MVRGRRALVLAVSLLITVPVAAGAIGPENGFQGQVDVVADDPAPEDREIDLLPGNARLSPTPDDDGAGSSGSNHEHGGNDSDGGERVTFVKSRAVPASAGVWWYEIFGASWTLFEEPPENLTGVRVEVTWETPTEGTPAGTASVSLEVPEHNYAQYNTSDSSPIRTRVLEEDYLGGPLTVEVEAAGPASAWANAEVTVYTTYWLNMEPDWSFTALE